MTEEPAAPRAGLPVRRPRSRPARLIRQLRTQWALVLTVLFLAGFAAAVVALAGGRGALGGRVDATGATTTTVLVPLPRATAKGAASSVAPGPTAGPGQPTLRLSALPPEVAGTLRLVEAGGPYPRADDGSAFENPARRLPARPLGWYRRYSVGAPERILVVGQDAATYWSTDGGATFVFVDRTR